MQFVSQLTDPTLEVTPRITPLNHAGKCSLAIPNQAAGILRCLSAVLRNALLPSGNV
jgi:hypothetical protein